MSASLLPVRRLCAGVVLMTIGLGAVAQKTAPKTAAPSAATAEQAGMPQAPKDAQDAKIAKLLQQVSPARVQATIEKLVSFGTRITTGPADAETVGKGHGIGAAREWIESEFQRYSDACSGCLEVKTDVFTEQPGGRIPQPTE